MTDFRTPDTRYSRRRGLGFKDVHSHRGVRTIKWFDKTPCSDPHVTGSNVISAPSIEGTPRGGTSGNALPELLSGGSIAEYDNGDPAPQTQIYLQQPFSRADHIALVSTANPRTGTEHIRWQEEGGNPTASSNLQLNWIEKEVCNGSSTWFTNSYSARVLPGDIVDWYVWATVSSTTPGPYIRLDIDVYDQSETWLQNFTIPDPSLTTSYAQYGMQVNMPASAYVIAAWVTCFLGVAGSTYFDLDDFTLGIA